MESYECIFISLHNVYHLNSFNYLFAYFKIYRTIMKIVEFNPDLNNQ